MYTNKSVETLISILKRQADGDYEMVGELELKNSPNWLQARAYFNASQKALETAQNWADREKQADPTPAKTNIGRFSIGDASIKTVNLDTLESDLRARVDNAHASAMTELRTVTADLRNDVEELREKLHIARGTAEIARTSANAAQATANDAIDRLEEFTSISTDSLKAGVSSLIDSRIIAAEQIANRHEIREVDTDNLKAGGAKVSLGDARIKVVGKVVDMDGFKIDGPKIAADVMNAYEIDNLKAENFRLRALLGIVDGHAGEIVSALSTAETTR